MKLDELDIKIDKICEKVDKGVKKFTPDIPMDEVNKTMMDNYYKAITENGISITRKELNAALHRIMDNIHAPQAVSPILLSYWKEKKLDQLQEWSKRFGIITKEIFKYGGIEPEVYISFLKKTDFDISNGAYRYHKHGWDANIDVYDWIPRPRECK